MNTLKSIEEIYEDVLAGKRKRFPKDTWTKDAYGYARFNQCLRHLIKKLNYTRDQIVDIDHDFIRTYKLRGALVQSYEDHVLNLISFELYVFRILTIPGILPGILSNDTLEDIISDPLAS